MVSDIEILIEHYIYDEIKNFFETEEKDKKDHILNRWIQTFQNDKNALSIILETFEDKAPTGRLFNHKYLTEAEYVIWDEMKQNLDSDYRWEKFKKTMDEIKELDKQLENK